MARAVKLEVYDENGNKVTGYPRTITEQVIDPVTGKSQKQVNDDFEALSKIVDTNLGWYGIEFDETIANSACRRIGSMEMHRTLPIQNRMKRCLLLDNGTVNYYLHDNDSTKKPDGSDAILDGSDGQMMVEIPEHWRKFEKDGTKWRVKISDYNVSGFHFVPKAYRSAYEATVHRPTNKLSSVMNMSPDYRGGNNNASLDGASNSLLGRPATYISGTNFALYAKNRGSRWCMDVYHVKKAMDWLYYIEYANFNSQLPFNSALTAEGFKQGGLSDGVTDLNGTKWSEFNGYYPFIPMGYTNSLGNKTGVKPFDMPVEYDENIFTTNVPSYRGVENPFGHIWKWADGLKINIQADDAGGESQMFVCEDPLLFQHSNYDGYEKRGLLPRANGYISKMIMGEFGELMPKEAAAGSTTYFADYWYTSLPASGESQRGVRFGGNANAGAKAGLACSPSSYAFSYTNATIGSRLCFLP